MLLLSYYRYFPADSWVGDVRVEVEREEGTVQVPDLRRVRSFKLRQEEWYGSLPGHSRHRSATGSRRDPPSHFGHEI